MGSPPIQINVKINTWHFAPWLFCGNPKTGLGPKNQSFILKKLPNHPPWVSEKPGSSVACSLLPVRKNGRQRYCFSLHFLGWFWCKNEKKQDCIPPRSGQIQNNYFPRRVLVFKLGPQLTAEDENYSFAGVEFPHSACRQTQETIIAFWL